MSKLCYVSRATLTMLSLYQLCEIGTGEPEECAGANGDPKTKMAEIDLNVESGVAAVQIGS
jgi:hypothetical protein